MLDIFMAKFAGPLLIASTTTALAIMTVNDIAAFSAVITVGCVSFYVAIRTAKSTLDRAEEATISGKYRSVRKTVVDLQKEVDARDRVIDSQRELIEHLRSELHAHDQHTE